MAFNAYLFKFDKRPNSTAKPSLTTLPSGTKTVLIDLKNAANLLSPDIILTHALFDDQTYGTPMDYNYVYIPSFKRWYFVNSGWNWENGTWSASLTVDVMATYKTEIGNANLYVLRAASDYDPAIADTKYPAKAVRLQQYQQPSTNPWKTSIGTSSLSDGFYCVGVLNASNTAVGATSYYAFTGAGMREFIKKLFDSPSWLNVTDTSISTDLQKLFLNPSQYIMSAVWIPLPFPVANPTAITSLPYGWWSVSGVTAYPMDSVSLTFSKDLFNLPMQNNPYIDGSYPETYLNVQPWTTCAVECFPFGVLPIDTCVMRQRNADKIYASVIMDSITGRGELIIETKAGSATRQYLASATAQVGVPIPMAQLSIDWGAIGGAMSYVKTAAALGSSEQAISNVENVGKNIFNRFRQRDFSPYETLSEDRLRSLQEQSAQVNADLFSSVKAVAADIGNGLAMALGTPSVTGSAGGFAGLYRKPAVIWQFTDQVTKDRTHYGMPLCAKRTINTLTGFILVQCGDDFTAACQQAERAQIVQILESGFYYE